MQYRESILTTRSFNAWGTDRVLFGRGAFDSLGQQVSALGATHVFVIVSATLAAKTGIRSHVERMLGDHVAGWQVGMPRHMPRPAVVEAAHAARAAGADLLLAIGGGSIVDSAKMIQLCLSEDITGPTQLDGFVTAVRADGNTWQPAIHPQAVRTVCVPTTLSGAEFTGRAGSVDPDRSLKQIFIHKDFAPQVVILDPALTMHTPQALWLSSGMRAVDHAVESLCSPDINAYGEGLARNGLRLLSKGLRRCSKDAADLDARIDCQLGAWSAIGALQAGATMGASHGIGHALGAFGVAHGHTSCVMLAPVLRYNLAVNPQRQRIVAELLDGTPGDAAGAVESLVRDLGLPTRLRDVGIRRDQLAAVAEGAMKDRWLHTNPRRIRDAQDVLKILESAW